MSEESGRSKWIRRLGLVALGAILLAFGADCATHSVDFPIYHRIARQILQGNYELYPKALTEGGPLPAHGFRYAPAIAFLFVPFGFLPLEAAAFLFFILKVAAFAYIGAVVARYMGLPNQYRSLMLMSLLFVGGYVVEEFRYGNFHFFSVALMVLAFDSAESGSVITPAAALGVAIAAKVTPVMLLAYFGLRRRLAVCVATVIVLVLLGVLPAALVGYDTNNRLLGGFARYAAEKIDEEDNYALRGVLVRYLTADHREHQTYPKTSLADWSTQAVWGVWVLILVAGGLVVAAALRREPSGPAVRLLEFSVVLTAMLLASPHTQRRYFTALYVPALALLALITKYPELPERGPVRIALAMTAAVSTVLPLIFGGRRLALVYEAWSPYFFGTLALFITLVLLTARIKGRTTVHFGRESRASQRV